MWGVQLFGQKHLYLFSSFKYYEQKVWDRNIDGNEPFQYESNILVSIWSRSMIPTFSELKYSTDIPYPLRVLCF